MHLGMASVVYHFLVTVTLTCDLIYGKIMHLDIVEWCVPFLGHCDLVDLDMFSSPEPKAPR